MISLHRTMLIWFKLFVPNEPNGQFFLIAIPLKRGEHKKKHFQGNGFSRKLKIILQKQYFEARLTKQIIFLSVLITGSVWTCPHWDKPFLLATFQYDWQPKADYVLIVGNENKEALIVDSVAVHKNFRTDSYGTCPA